MSITDHVYFKNPPGSLPRELFPKTRVLKLSCPPARIAQLARALDLKTQGCGFDGRAGQPNNY